MKKSIAILLATIVSVSASFLFVACSKQSTLPDGTYKMESSSGNPFDPDETLPLGALFDVSGNTITVNYSKELVFSLEYEIKGKEIIMTNEDGNERVLAFEKKNNQTYIVGKTTYKRSE